jgi:stage V sporulation protein B
MLRNAGFLLLTELTVRLAALLLAVAIARSAGSSGYGQYVYALAYAGSYAAFADFGASRYLTRAIARDRKSASYLLAAALAAKGVVLLPSLTAAVVLTAWQPATDRPLLLLFLAGGTVQSLASLLRAVLYGFERMDLDTACRLVERTLAVGGALLALLLGRGMLGVGVAMLLAGTLDLGLVSVLTARYFARPIERVPWRAVVSTLRSALPLGLFGLVLALYAGLPLFLLRAWQGMAAAGEYGVAMTPVIALLPLPVTVAAAALPVLTRLASTDRAALQATFGVLLRLFCLAGLVVTPGVMIVADAVVALVYGPAFVLSGPTLRILAVGLLGAFPMQVCINLLVATGAQRLLLWIDGAALAWQCAADVVAIPRWGIEGAALGTASAELLAAILFAGTAFRVAGRPALAPLLRGIPATAGMAAAAIPLLHIGLVPSIAGGALAYVTLFLLCRTVSMREVQTALTLLQRRVV